MGLTMSTCLEMYTNPHDLSFTIGQVEQGGKFAIAITRGPGHRFKLLISSVPFAESREKAADAVKEVLDTVARAASEGLADRSSFASQIINPDGKKIDPSRILNSSLIGWIYEELKKGNPAGTYAPEALAISKKHVEPVAIPTKT